MPGWGDESMSDTIQVLIVDDHPLFRRGVRWSLEAETDILVVGEAGDGQTAVQMADMLVPDVVLIDINMPQMSGLEVTRILKRRHPQTGVIILTMHEDDEQLFHAIRVGAAAYCTKDVEAEEIVKLIRRVARGEYLINENVLSRPIVASRVLDQFHTNPAGTPFPAFASLPLTQRETEILRRLSEGLGMGKIDQELGASRLVMHDLTSILRKLAVNDRAQAAATAFERSWFGAAGKDARPAARGAGDPFSRFTRRAKNALGYANDEADRQGRDRIGTEHLLVGLLSDEGAVAAWVLAEQDLDLDSVRRAIAQAAARDGVVTERPDPNLLTPRAKHAIWSAIESARRFGHAEIGTGHLLLGLTGERGGTAAGILERLGCRVEEVEKRTTVVLVQGATDDPEGDGELPVVV